MEILILSKRQSAAAGRRLGGLAIASLALALCTGAIAAAWWGYKRGGADMLEAMLNDSDQSTEAWQREIVLQRDFLRSLRSDLNADLSVLAANVGQMQGAVTRLDAENAAVFHGVLGALSRGLKLDPSRSCCGLGSDARSIKVGYRSTNSTMPLVTVPAPVPSGMRTMRGTRIDSSNWNCLRHSPPCSFK